MSAAKTCSAEAGYSRHTNAMLVLLAHACPAIDTPREPDGNRAGGHEPPVARGAHRVTLPFPHHRSGSNGRMPAGRIGLMLEWLVLADDRTGALEVAGEMAP